MYKRFQRTLFNFYRTLVTYYIQFRDGTPENILCKIKDLDENNTVWLDPWAFDGPEDEDYNLNVYKTELPSELIKLINKELD